MHRGGELGHILAGVKFPGSLDCYSLLTTEKVQSENNNLRFFLISGRIHPCPTAMPVIKTSKAGINTLPKPSGYAEY